MSGREIPWRVTPRFAATSDTRVWCLCDACDGSGTIEGGRLGANDPDLRQMICDVCEGTGEVPVEPEEDEE